MGSLVRSAAALLLTSLLALLFGTSSVLSQDLRERDALCNADGCFVAYFQRKTFLDSWKACKENGGNLATIKRKEDATTIASLFSTLDLRHSRTNVQVWIGLQRHPRQCTSARPLRGYSWTTGDQDTEYTNWKREDSPSMCSVSRCVVMGYSTQEQIDNFKWLDGSCSVPVDGYLCHYVYKGMCPALQSEGGGNALYTTPFNLLSTLLTHVPFGSVATLPCPSDTKEEQSVLCMLKEDGSAGWSRDSPLCFIPPLTHSWCDPDNDGCEPPDVCHGARCEFECLPLSDVYRCACPEGYMLAPDEHGCLDVDECLQSPCEQICANAPGTFECQCQKGYDPDVEGGCEDADECINDPCEHACENTPGSHICHCHLGFSPVPEDPSRCQDTDECQIPGTCEQMCVNYEGGFECYCEEGYELMSDHYSCGKTGEGGGQSAVTPPFLWVTHQPESEWDYDWDSRHSHTDWPPGEEEQALDWLTEPPRVVDSDVIWVTRAPREDLPFDLALETTTQEPEEDFENAEEVDWLAWEQGSQYELEILPITTIDTNIPTTPPPTTESITTPDYTDVEEETTTDAPFLSTSTISEGAWNWWVELTTTSQKAGNPEDSAMGHNTPTNSIYNTADEDQDLFTEDTVFPEELGEEEKDYVAITHSQQSAVPTQLAPFQPPLSKDGDNADILDSESEDREKKQSSTWLLVGLLVPICIFIVVMVGVGIVYCTRCAVQPRNKNATDCYHWISGAHDKQGAPNATAGVKTHV